MPVEKRPAGSLQGTAGRASQPAIHLCIPELTGDEDDGDGTASSSQSLRHLEPDPVALARSRISEKRFREGHRQVTGIIEDLRARRQGRLNRLWIGSIALTAASVIVLAIGLFRETTDATQPSRREGPPSKARSSSTNSLSDHSAAEISRSVRVQANMLPEDDPIQPVAYEASPESSRAGAWLDGTITDKETSGPADGTLHDDP